MQFIDNSHISSCLASNICGTRDIANGLLQAAQKQLEQQVAAAEQLTAEVEQLKSENLEAWQLKYELEGQTAAYKANLEGMQRQGSCMQKVSRLPGDSSQSLSTRHVLTPMPAKGSKQQQRVTTRSAKFCSTAHKGLFCAVGPAGT